MSERTAIVTLAVGDDFKHRWHRDCERNWRAYAERHGYELICVTEPLDDSRRARERSPSWQKLLLLGQPFARDLDRLVWVDSDVVFGREAPAITDGVPVERLGAVDELALPTSAIKRMIHPKPMEVYYGEFGLPGSFDHVVQAGVMVTSPRHHREVFEYVYDNYEDKPDMFYEMRPLSYELLDRDLVHWLDPRFNMMWMTWKAWKFPYLLDFRRHPGAREAARTGLEEAFCLHFAGEADQMEFALGKPPARRRPPLGPPTRAPVVLLTFARPDTTAQVLGSIRRARPGRLLVVGNAARAGVDGEAERVERTRALLDGVDWDCEVHTEFASEHLSQTERIESGLDRAFGLYEEAIVLEDDCVPDPSFFRYCDELLERYRDDPRVMSIGGTNFQFDRPASSDSYYFSRYSMTWGWASWRRAWDRHDPGMGAWPELRENGWLREQFPDPSSAAYWAHILDRTHRERDAWDYAWLLSCWLAESVHAIPNVNLVSNVGFRGDATHTRPEHGRAFASLPVHEMEFPLRHPPRLETNRQADVAVDKIMFGGMLSDMFGRVRRMREVKMKTSW